MSNEKATARPWQICDDGSEMFGDPRFIIWGPRGAGYGTVCRTLRQGLQPTADEAEEAQANAELIVTAVNERDELIAKVGRLREALEFAVKNGHSWTALDWRNWINNHARAALSLKGEGE